MSSGVYDEVPVAVIEYGKADDRRPRRWLLIACVSVLTFFTVLAALLFFLKAPTSMSGQAVVMPNGIGITTPPQRFDATAVFGVRVKPVLDQLAIKDEAAAKRAVEGVRAFFDTAKAGAPEFAESIIGPFDATKTGYLAVKGKWQRWRYSDPSIDPVKWHVQWNYEQCVTSGPKIRDQALHALAQLDQDFRANRNEALQAIGSSLRAADLPSNITIDPAALDRYCEAQLRQSVGALSEGNIAENAGIDSAIAATGSTVITMVVEQSIKMVIASVSAEAGGSVAVGTAGGAAGGSWIPGPGTAIGAAAGFLGGVAFDVWQNHKSKEKVVGQVCQSLDELRDHLLNGDGEQEQGLNKLFAAAAKDQVLMIGDKIRGQLKEATH